MKYTLNITDTYACLIYFDQMTVLKHYISLPAIDKFGNHHMQLEYTAINMEEDIWRDQILSVNPDSIIAEEKDVLIRLKKAKLIIEQVRSYDLRVIKNQKTYLHSSDLKFYEKDRYIVCCGYSLDYPETVIYTFTVFSGDILLEFTENDIIFETIIREKDNGSDCDYIKAMDLNEMYRINEDTDSKIKSRNNMFDPDKFNNIESLMWDFDFRQEYFLSPADKNPKTDYPIGYYEAIKNYP